jgi:NAD(P)-dependent dehydrogenase (short-subunit alcohol dehydrogenase family)
MHVAVVDVNAERAAEVAAGLALPGRRAESFMTDVSEREAVEALATAVFEEFGGCHLLHNNAGVSPLGRAWSHSAEEWRRVVGVNLMGVVNGVSVFVPRLIEQGEEAHVVNTASAAALRYTSAHAMYAATKFGVLGYTECLRAELAPHRIGVSVLCPGGVDTNISDTIRGVAGAQRSDEDMAELLDDLYNVDTAHVTVITPDQVGAVVVEAVRNNDAYIVTHPGSRAAVEERARAIDDAYAAQRERHPELP